MEYFATGPSKFISSLSSQDIKAITVLTALDITEPCMISQKKNKKFYWLWCFYRLTSADMIKMMILTVPSDKGNPIVQRLEIVATFHAQRCRLPAISLRAGVFLPRRLWSRLNLRARAPNCADQNSTALAYEALLCNISLTKSQPTHSYYIVLNWYILLH